jgi:hypothetical protein
MFRTLTICFLVLSSFSVFGQKKKPVVSAKAKAATGCQLTQAPPLRSFFLGQTVDQVEKLIPGFKTEFLKEKEDGSGEVHRTDYSGAGENRLTWKDVGGVSMSAYFDEDSRLIIDDFDDAPAKLSFGGDVEGLHKLVWWFYEDRIYGFSIYYADYIPETAQSFVKQLSEKSSLPATGWKKLKTDFPDARGIPGAPTFVTDIEASLECIGFKVRVHTAYRDSASITLTDTKVEAGILETERRIKEQRRKDELERIRREREKANTLKP